MKKGYHDYTPVIKKEKKEYKKHKCPFTGLKHPPDTKFVKEDVFKLQFGFEYPKVPPKYTYVQPIRYPKTDGSNGKISRFR